MKTIHCIDESIRDAMKAAEHTPSLRQHVYAWKEAFKEPAAAIVALRYFERGLVHSITGWAEMAAAHERMYDSLIGEDGVLGPAWKAIGESLITMLNGERGGLDGGTLDRLIRDIADAGGITLGE